MLIATFDLIVCGWKQNLLYFLKHEILAVSKCGWKVGWSFLWISFQDEQASGWCSQWKYSSYSLCTQFIEFQCQTSPLLFHNSAGMKSVCLHLVNTWKILVLEYFFCFYSHFLCCSLQNAIIISPLTKKRMSQPIDLKVDEETLMKLVPFWRTSLAPAGTPSTQFYFRQFEVHPIKVPCFSFCLSSLIVTL